MPTDLELQRRLRRASTKRRLKGIGYILMGGMLMTFGYFSNTAEQRAFTEQMNSRKTALDPVINSVPLLAAGRELSTPLMNLMPIVMMGLGLLSGGMGVRSLVRRTSEIEKEEVEVELRSSERQRPEPDKIGEAELRFDGAYKSSAKGSANTLLRFYANGIVAYESSLKGKTPIRFYIELQKVSDPSALDEKTVGKKTLSYSVDGDRVSIAVPQWHPNAIDAAQSILGDWRGSVGFNHLKLGNVEYAFVAVV